MPRFLLIGRENGQVRRKPYGVKTRLVNMHFVIFIGAVITIASCDHAPGEGRIFNNYKYLEYLNDLDRRNAELEYDMHKQWPFHFFNEPNENGPNELDENFGRDGDLRFQEILNRLNRPLPIYYGSRNGDRFAHGWKNLREATDRANQLSQYLRYKTPSGQDPLEEVRMYPQEEDFTFSEDNENENKYFQGDNNDEETTNSEENQILPDIVYRPPPNLDEADDGAEATEAKPEETDHGHEEHENYKFKDGEEFPHTFKFNEVPLADDPSEFAVGPSDTRFFRDTAQSEEVTLSPNTENLEPNNLRIYQTQPKVVASRSDTNQQIETFPLNQELSLGSAEKDVEVVPFKPDMAQTDTAGVYIIAVVAGISAAATVGLIAVGIGWYNLQKHMKNAEDTDYPSYGIVGPNKEYEKKERDDAGDRRLAQSAQMYHYQHQKQQIIAMGRNPQGGHGSQSDTEEEEDEEGNYTVYECPGLASIEGPLEVKNPMFDDDQLATPSQTPSKPTNAEDNKPNHE